MNKDDSEFIKMNLVGLREQFQSKHANSHFNIERIAEDITSFMD